MPPAPSRAARVRGETHLRAYALSRHCSVDLRYGLFRAYVFQDIIDKHYIIALAYGDIVNARTLYTRLHSSCVTSETCSAAIATAGSSSTAHSGGSPSRHRHPFLPHAGRPGRGYVAKARDRMLVQASLDRLSTFQAYAAMGLEKDHRNYENISEICHLLGLTAPFVVLTNNPPRSRRWRAGDRHRGTETLEFEPSPSTSPISPRRRCRSHPHPPGETRCVTPCRRTGRPVQAARVAGRPAFHLRRQLFSADVAGRRRHSPGGKPVSGAVPEKGHRTLHGRPTAARTRLPAHSRQTVSSSKLPRRLKAFKRENPRDPIGDLLATPYWFRVHVYYDIVTSHDFVVLTMAPPGHRHSRGAPAKRVPLQPLPLRAVENQDKFRQAVKHIVTYGAGAVLLLYNDVAAPVSARMPRSHAHGNGRAPRPTRPTASSASSTTAATTMPPCCC